MTVINGQTGSPVRRKSRWRVITFFGAAFILAGLGLLGYVSWQYFGTNIVSKQKQAMIKKDVTAEWSRGIDGNAIGLLRIPRLGKDYEAPIVPGFDPTALAKGVGSYPKGAKPGEIGNFAIAGHRVTHGELFRDFLKLRKGDKIVVETRTKIFTYKLRDNGTDRTLDFTVGWPLMSNPIDRNFIPTKPILTMLTCSELFHTRNRNVVFGDLVSTAEKSSKVLEGS